MRVSGSEDNVSLNLGINDLTNNVRIGDTNNETILGSVVLVLVLND